MTRRRKTSTQPREIKELQRNELALSREEWRPPRGNYKGKDGQTGGGRGRVNGEGEEWANKSKGN